MKVEPVDGGVLRVWVSTEELRSKDILLENIDEQGCPKDEQTRRHMYRLIRQALSAAGRQPYSDVLVEWIPVNEGFVLLVSPLHAKPTAPQVYAIPDADALYMLAERWHYFREENAPGNALYERDEGYDLVVYPLPGPWTARRRLLEEHGRLRGCGQIAAAVTAEHGRLLADTDALHTLLFTTPAPVSPAPGDTSH
ncbi:MAG: hypothetical protein II363_05465 [Clostridia bacterium]|nr:hypothetical protein [Clostridia bacterium]